MLTNKRHIEFVNQYMINGMNATAAYKYVYKVVSNDVAERSGSRLLSNVDVKAEIEARQKVNIAISKKTVDDIISDLTQMIEDYKKDGKVAHNAIAAIKELNKMMGNYAPDKVDVTTGGDKLNTININIIKPDGNQS